MKNCSKCGSPNHDRAVVCYACKQSFTPPLPQRSPTAPTTPKLWYKTARFKTVCQIVVAAEIVGFIIFLCMNPILQGSAPASTDCVLSEQSVTELINDVLGDTNRKGVKRVQYVALNSADYVTVAVAVDNGGWDMSSARRELGENIRAVGKALLKKYPQITTFQYVPTLPMKDKYGERSEMWQGNMVYEEETTRRIQWDNLRGEEVIQAADHHQLPESFYD